MAPNGGGASSSLAMVCQLPLCVISLSLLTGKGMHDGAGAWLKASAARACLAGVGISSVEEFFHFCQQFLNTNMSNRNFTSGVALQCLCITICCTILTCLCCRAAFLPDFHPACSCISCLHAIIGTLTCLFNLHDSYLLQVKGLDGKKLQAALEENGFPTTGCPSKLHILATKEDHDGWYFWATTDHPNTLVQRRVGCPCQPCKDGQFHECKQKEADSSSGVWWNRPYYQACSCTVTLTLTQT